MESNYRNTTLKSKGKYDTGKVLPVKIEGFSGGDLFRILDGGMSPTYDKNDILVCSRGKSIRNLDSDALAIFQINGNHILKRLVLVENHILLVSDNRNFPLFEVDAKDISAVWEVVRKMTPAILNGEPYPGKGIAYLENELKLLKESLSILEERLRNPD